MKTMDRSEFVVQRSRAACTRGREIRDALIGEYQTRYGVSMPPPPAIIVDELLRDFLDARIREVPLEDHVFAETEWDGQRFVVNMNSRTSLIAGVKDAEGVQAVGKWHEIIHIVDNADYLKEDGQSTLPGFEFAKKVTCYRALRRGASEDERAREFWAEEAGRAAAVSMIALARSEAFQELVQLGARSAGRPVNGFPLLYPAAEYIGVNITALVKQLTHDGKISIVRESGKNLVLVQTPLPSEDA